MFFRAFISTLLFLLSFSAKSTTEATFAIASNFAHSAQQIKQQFEFQSPFKLRLVMGSSGKISAQIRHGAPFDGFLSADYLRPKQLIAEGHAAKGSLINYALGRLVYWAPHSDDGKDLDLKVILASKRISIASPKLAPYGRASAQLLSEQYNGHLVLGENIAQAFHFTKLGRVDGGLIAKSQWLRLAEEERRPYWLVPANKHQPILQSAVLTIAGSQNPAARAFWQYLQSPEAKRIIKDNGYELPAQTIK